MTTSHPALSTATSPDTSSSPRPAPTGRRWAWVPALLLVSLIGTQLGVVAAVLDDPTFSTEPDYYRKAVDWDAHMARARKSQALGWQARARVEPALGAAGARSSLALTFTGPRGEPITGARVSAVAFHNAHAAQPLALELREALPGEYRAELGAARPGLWELRLTAARGAETFEMSSRTEVAAPGEQ
jgi:nitrogen fixation protein FixH